MIALEYVDDDSGASSRNFHRLAQLVIDTGGRALRLSGPYDVSSTSLGAGSVSSVTLTHDANFVTDYVVLAMRVDSTRGFNITEVNTARTANTATFSFANLGGLSATLILRCYLLG